MSAGRIYAGVPTNVDANITGDSSFTVQYVTKYMPSSFNTTGKTMTQKLTTSCEETYLIDEETNIGFTLDEKGGLINVTEGALGDYTVNKSGDDYMVTYKDKDGKDVEDLLTVKSDASDTFADAKFPVGTMITLVAQIDSYTPTYWYYYCTGETGDIDLSDFVRMNTDMSEPDHFDFEKASGENVSYTSSKRITESYSFIFDFSKTGLSVDKAEADGAALTGKLRLLHTYNNNGTNIDIMDYVASKTVGSGDTAETAYTRKYPAISQTFKVYNGTGDLSVSASAASAGTDAYDVELQLAYSNEHGQNTRYEERQYAVLLERVGEDGNALAFPEGTTFTYNGETLTPGAGNTSVSVPVGSLGTHTVTIENSLLVFDEGTIRLKATVYSAPDAHEYNELRTGAQDTFELIPTASPTYSLDAKSQGSASHKLAPGSSLTLDVETLSSTGSDSQPVSVQPYRLDATIFRSSRTQKYSTILLTDVFTGASDTCSPGNWSANVTNSAPQGTYRLAFTYHNKVDYWDFVVM